MRWLETKTIIAWAPFAAVVCVVMILGLVIWAMSAIQAQRVQVRAEAAAKIEASRLQATRAAAAKCERDRAAALEQAGKRREEAKASLQRCRDDFLRTKTTIVLESMEQQCRQPQIELIAAERRFKTVNARICSLGAE